jgi:hypothetical protein
MKRFLFALTAFILGSLPVFADDRGQRRGGGASESRGQAVARSQPVEQRPAAPVQHFEQRAPAPVPVQRFAQPPVVAPQHFEQRLIAPSQPQVAIPRAIPRVVAPPAGGVAPSVRAVAPPVRSEPLDHGDRRGWDRPDAYRPDGDHRDWDHRDWDRHDGGFAYRPYVFTPRWQIGVGIFAGYPVPYTYAYPFPVSVYGYAAPASPVVAGPDSNMYGGVTLDITPNDATVIVDGAYAGIVQSFDGSQQPLTLTAGTHQIEINRPGFVSLAMDVTVQPGQIVPYRGDMTAAQ